MELVRIPKELADEIERLGFKTDEFVVEALENLIAEAVSEYLKKR